jgi:hypothetical protein
MLQECAPSLERPPDGGVTLLHGDVAAGKPDHRASDRIANSFSEGNAFLFEALMGAADNRARRPPNWLILVKEMLSVKERARKPFILLSDATTNRTGHNNQQLPPIVSNAKKPIREA